MSNKNFEQLLSKYLNNTISQEELEILLEYIKDLDDQTISSKISELYTSEDLIYDQVDKARIFTKISSSIHSESNRKQKTFSIKKSIWIAAACCAAILSFGVLFKDKVNKPVFNALAKNDIVIPQNAIVISSTDGQKILVNQNEENQYQLGDLKVHVDLKGSISYEVLHTRSSTSEPITISTPAGKTSYIKLRDGSELWLNANSRATFYPEFSSTKREVKLQGEGYFEVTKDASRPFVVNTENMNIKVLGTGFNVSAYKNDHASTTLIHGRVNVQTQQSNQLLKPNQQFIRTMDGSTAIRSADIEEVTAWRNGNFVFNHKNIREVVNILSKWYPIQDIKFVNTSGETFTGTIKKERSLRNVLDQLEFISNYSFDILDDKLTINTRK